MHPGGPCWRRKDEGARSIPKGLTAAGEDPLFAAGREFKEETDFDIEGAFFALDTMSVGRNTGILSKAGLPSGSAACRGVLRNAV